MVLDQSGGILNFGLTGTTPNVSQYARLESNTNSDPNTGGLKQNMDFVVFGIFDLIVPALGEFYGIRLEDRVGGVGSDILDLRVRNINGTPVILFRKTDQVADTQVGYELLLDPGHDQIALGFLHPGATPGVPGTKTIQAGFAYVDSGSIGPDIFFSQTFDIFNGEVWTRAGFVAGANVVPEPASLALVGLGLVGLALSRRKQA